VEPITGYATLGGRRIAYQVIGDGPTDLVLAPSWLSTFDMEWEQPMIRQFLQRLASFARVIRFDRRGSGASDPLPDDVLPVWETFAEDIECVMDAVGSESAFLYADGDAGPLGILYAATRPDRVTAMILFNTTARFLVADDYPIGFPLEFVDAISEEMTDDWGTGERMAMYVPSRAGDKDLALWMGRLMRATTTPSSVKKYMDGVITADVRDILESVDMPVLVLHPTESQLLTFDHGRFLAGHLPNSTLVELSGPGDVYPAFALADQVVGAIGEFVTGAPSPMPAERALATVLFTDIVESTARAGEIGDSRWRELLDRHDETAQRDVGRHSGELVKNTGDGILATFDGPGRGISFASTFRSDLAGLGLEIRTGIHTGEIELRDHDVGGMAVHLGARIMEAAGPGEILVSRTVKDLVIGSPIAFEDRGMHAFKGIDGEWQLYSVATS
jgi:class 3 adenylate cyclase/pimeloyl-ACP methyl ester carboxylesterase